MPDGSDKRTPKTRKGPRHVAIIMDGNGRWAQARGRPRLFGHHAGARRVREIVAEAVAATRSLTWGLSPPILYQLGLAAALNGLAQRSFEQYGLHVDVKADPAAEPESEALLVLLFRSVQELLLNVVKHAQVSRANVRLARLETGEIQVEVSDHGVGFDPEAQRQTAVGGIGLVSLRERLEHLGGRMEVRAATGAGTLIRLVGPLSGGLPEGSGS
ncbi:MAG: undecaprenyl diphosphate synthase family protein [Roseovarius sp.]|nr:undecaprenyl diphosphate synthase family protein [Roseovarius sp.]